MRDAPDATKSCPLLPAALPFDGADVEIIARDGRPWLGARQIDVALGYSDRQRGPQSAAPFGRITDIYRRHADEFTDEMTALVELPTAGGMQKVRIFSPRGCHLIAMFARTPKVKAFRRWVLDVLDQLGQRTLEPEPLALPSPLPVRPVSAFAGLVFKAVGPILDMER